MSRKTWIYAGLGIAAGMGAVGLVKLLSGPRVVKGKSRVFLLGDSLAVGLRPHLQVLASEARVAFDALAKEGTRIDQWAQSTALNESLQQFQPTLILVSLGTNDEYLASSAAGRQKPYLETLLRKLNSTGADVAWIGPPKLPKANSNGVVPLIRSTVKESHYFPSDTLTIPRGPDSLHPTARGYASWAGALWRWLS